MECKFVVGQKVVCIIKRKWRRFVDHGPADGPVDGEVCKITDIVVLGILDYIGIQVEGHLGTYNYIHFRPLDERKTDISMFTKLLTPIKSKTPELV